MAAPAKKHIYEGSKYSKADVLKLKELFDKHDLDKNGKVTISELIKSLEGDKYMRHKELSAFRALDINHDGVLTLNEYIKRVYPLATEREFAAMLSWTAPGTNKAPLDETFHPTPAQLEEIKIMFNYYDKNRDGAISLDELVAVAEKCGFDGRDIEDLFDTTDLDKDGKISFDEFIQLMKTSYV